MEIVISVPKSWEKCNNTFLRNCIRNGKVLPKGHGRLIGADELKVEVFRACMDKYFMPTKFLDCDTITEIIDNAQTIIEADKEVDE